MQKALLAAVLLACGCHRVPPPKLGDAVPPAATAIAGLDLAALRTSPLLRRLPPPVAALRDASRVLLVWDGRDLLIVADGTPSGYSTIAPGISAAGSPHGIETARLQIALGRTGAPDLVNRAGKDPVWAVIQGEGRLPLTGDLANLFNLLRDAQYTTVSSDLRDPSTLNITADCASAEKARRFEASLRAMVTLAAAAAVRQPEIGTQLRAFRITREERTVRGTGTVSAQLVAKFF